MWLVFNQYINQGVRLMVEVGGHALLPILCAAFVLGVTIRLIIFLTVKAESAFALEFEKRVHKYLADPSYIPNVSSFHELTRKLLERTFEEHYNLRRKHRRRRFDQITSISDRVFLVVEGARRLIGDTLSQTKYLRKGGQTPRFVDISKFVFESNPVFNRVLGLFPLGMFNDLLNILPGLFVVGGIFGTFLGVMSALPELSHIDMNDVAKTKDVMDKFLLNMAFSMGASSIGIIFSVMLTIINAMLNPEGIYYAMVNKFSSALEFLWNDTSNNDVAEETVYSTDRRAVVYTNESAKRVQGTVPSAAPKVTPVPSEPVTAPVEAAVAASAPPAAPEVNEVWPMPPPRQEPPAPEPDVEAFDDVFERRDDALSSLDPSSPAAPAPADLDDRLAVLRHRLQVLDSYLVKANEDRASGLMSDIMWEEETTAYRLERGQVDARLRELETKKAA